MNYLLALVGSFGHNSAMTYDRATDWKTFLADYSEHLDRNTYYMVHKACQQIRNDPGSALEDAIDHLRWLQERFETTKKKHAHLLPAEEAEFAELNKVISQLETYEQDFK